MFYLQNKSKIQSLPTISATIGLSHDIILLLVFLQMPPTKSFLPFPTLVHPPASKPHNNLSYPFKLLGCGFLCSEPSTAFHLTQSKSKSLLNGLQCSTLSYRSLPYPLQSSHTHLLSILWKCQKCPRLKTFAFTISSACSALFLGNLKSCFIIS